MQYERWTSTLNRNITVAVITGSRPPEVCGVGDYAARLCSALRTIEVDARLVHVPHPTLFSLPAVLRAIAETDADLVHVQYPTMGYGRSVVPYLLSTPLLRIPRIVTLHEYSIFRFYRKPAFAAFAWGARARIFSNAREMAVFARHHPVRRGVDVEIPIGSNMPIAKGEAVRSNEIIYFGQIMPNKGLESFLDLARLAHASGENLHLAIVGAIPEIVASRIDVSRMTCAPEIQSRSASIFAANVAASGSSARIAMRADVSTKITRYPRVRRSPAW